VDVVELRVGERPGKIDALDLGAEMRGDGFDGNGLAVHGAFPRCRDNRAAQGGTQPGPARQRPMRARKSAGCMGRWSRKPCAWSTLSQVIRSHISWVSTPSATTL